MAVRYETVVTVDLHDADGSRAGYMVIEPRQGRDDVFIRIYPSGGDSHCFVVEDIDLRQVGDIIHRFRLNDPS